MLGGGENDSFPPRARFTLLSLFFSWVAISRLVLLLGTRATHRDTHPRAMRNKRKKERKVRRGETNSSSRPATFINLNGFGLLRRRSTRQPPARAFNLGLHLCLIYRPPFFLSLSFSISHSHPFRFFFFHSTILGFEFPFKKKKTGKKRKRKHVFISHGLLYTLAWE